MGQTAIVVGGGPAGLIAAAHLARAGLGTTLLEASGRLGGRAATDHRDGFALNQGPHALYLGGPAVRELAALGVDPSGWNPVSWRSGFLRDGRFHRAPGGTPGLARWAAALLRDAPAPERATVPVAAWLREALPRPRARASAATLVRLATFVADHEALSTDVAVTQLRSAARGVRYLDGGWRSLVDALADAARTHGATLRTSAGVRAVERTGPGGVALPSPGRHELDPTPVRTADPGAGRWVVRLDDEVLTADVVVVAAGGPADAAGLLGDRAPDAPGPSAEVSVLDLGLDRLPRPTRTFALGVDEPAYLSRHSRNGTAPLLTVATYGRRPRAELERIAEAVQPGWAEHAVLARYLPRMVAVTAIATARGGGLPGRPGTDLGDGLALAGDWIGPEGWLVDAALASGAAAAAAVLGAGPPRGAAREDAASEPGATAGVKA